MQPTLTSRERQLELEEAVHRNKDDPAIWKVVELLAVYQASAINKVLSAEGKRGVFVGQARAYGNLLRIITQGPTTVDSIKLREGYRA